MTDLPIWECRRYRKEYGEEWKGCLLIAAESKELAEQMFFEIEDDFSVETDLLYDVMAHGEPRIIYNDHMR